MCEPLLQHLLIKSTPSYRQDRHTRPRSSQYQSNSLVTITLMCEPLLQHLLIKSTPSYRQDRHTRPRSSQHQSNSLVTITLMCEPLLQHLLIKSTPSYRQDRPTHYHSFPEGVNVPDNRMLYNTVSPYREQYLLLYH